MFDTHSAFDDDGHGDRGAELLPSLPGLGKALTQAFAPKLALSTVSWLFAVAWSDLTNGAGLDLVGLLLAGVALLVLALILIVASIARRRGDVLDD